MLGRNARIQWVIGQFHEDEKIIRENGSATEATKSKMRQNKILQKLLGKGIKKRNSLKMKRENFNSLSIHPPRTEPSPRIIFPFRFTQLSQLGDTKNSGSQQGH
jgi:hypothetical protein